MTKGTGVRARENPAVGESAKINICFPFRETLRLTARSQKEYGLGPVTTLPVVDGYDPKNISRSRDNPACGELI